MNSITAAGKWEALSRGSLLCFVVSVPIVAWAVHIGVALTASHLIAMFLMVLAAGVGITLRRRARVDLATFALACFVVVATVTVARVLLGPNVVIFEESLHRKAVKQLVGLYFAFGLFVALRYLADTFRLGPFLARIHLRTAVILAVLAILQFFVALWDINSSLANFPIHNSTLGEMRRLGTGVLLYGFPRVSLTFVEPSRLGIYLLTGWALWLYALERGDQGWPSGKWTTAGGIVLGATVLMTGSRAAHVVFFILAIAAVLVRPHRLHRLMLVVASLVLVAALTGPWNAARITATLLPEVTPALTFPPPPARRSDTRVPAADSLRDILPDKAVEKLREMQERVNVRLIAAGARAGVSARHRIGSLVVALSVFRDYPLLGMGYGTSEFAMAMRYPLKEMGQIVDEGFRPTMLGVHAVLLTETGLAGVLCVFGLGWAVCLALARAIRHGDHRSRALGWGMAASLGGYAIAMTGQAIEIYQLLLVWLLLAIALTLDPGASRKNTPST